MTLADLTHQLQALRSERSYLIEIAEQAKAWRWGDGTSRDLDSALIAWRISTGDIPEDTSDDWRQD